MSLQKPLQQQVLKHMTQQHAVCLKMQTSQQHTVLDQDANAAAAKEKARNTGSILRKQDGDHEIRRLIDKRKSIP